MPNGNESEKTCKAADFGQEVHSDVLNGLEQRIQWEGHQGCIAGEDLFQRGKLVRISTWILGIKRETRRNGNRNNNMD